MSNPYYVWYHNKDKNLRAETLDGSDSLLVAGNGDYQEYTVTPIEQQLPNISIGDEDKLLGAGDDEGDLFALTESTSQMEPVNGHAMESQDIAFLSSDAAPAGADDSNIFAVQSASASNDLDTLFTMGSTEGGGFPDPLIFYS